MTYIHIPTLRYPLNPKDIRAENPNTSFPETFVPPPEYAAVTRVPRPEHNALTHKAEEAAPVLIDGVWTQQWAVVALSDEEVAQINQSAASSVRAERDRLLTETDWVVIKATETGQAIPSDWSAYRQALRDITEQTGFPFEVVWPVKP